MTDHRLDVYYDLYVDGKAVFQDKEIEEISGAGIVEAGVFLRKGVRDCELHFGTRIEREAARIALEKSGFRFIA